jgi:hypothetical protein
LTDTSKDTLPKRTCSAIDLFPFGLFRVARPRTIRRATPSLAGVVTNPHLIDRALDQLLRSTYTPCRRRV